MLAVMAAGKDYYSILGISKNATQDEIKKAYRQLAREHHPDVAKGSNKTAAEKRFKEVGEAYSVLSDSQKRKMYDQYGTADPRGFGGAGPFGGGAGGPFGGFGGPGSARANSGGQWGEPFTYTYSTGGGNEGGAGANPFGDIDIDPFEIFNTFFGGGFARSAPRKGRSLRYEMSLTFSEAVHGTEKEVSIESGKTTLKVPAGVKEGMEIKFAGKGMPGPTNTPPGDLYIIFRVALPKQFKWVPGGHLATAIEIDFAQAVLGDEIEVPVVDVTGKTSNTAVGTAKLKIPTGTQHGTQFRLRGKGMPLVNDRGYGDVYAQVFINIPKRLNKKQKKLLEEYQNLT